MKKLNQEILGKNNQQMIEMIVGKRIKIIGNSGHNYGVVGTVFEADCFVGWNGTSAQLKNNLGYINFYDLELSILLTVEELNKISEDNLKKIVDITVENTEIANKIKFITDNNLTNFDEDLYKVNTVLNTLDNAGLSTLERAKIIANLIKN